jgi:hypothetical protein
MVRIHFPPARSLRTFSSEAAKPPAPFYRPTRRALPICENRGSTSRAREIQTAFERYRACPRNQAKGTRPPNHSDLLP